jgi:hypothetical protein
MLRVLAWIVIVVANASALAVIVSVILAAFRRWMLVATVSRLACLGGLAGFLLPLLGLLILVVLTRFDFAPESFLGVSNVDPAQKARIVAETISALMNCGVVALGAGVLGASVWALARWRMKVATTSG